MTAADLLDILSDEIADGNIAFVNNLLDQARAQIAAGGGEIAPLLSGNVNAKSFSRTVRMDAAQVARVCRQAIADAGDGGPVVSTGLDFSRLNFLD